MSIPNFSAEEWLKYLEPQLDEQSRASREYSQYYDGEHKLQFATQKFLESFATFFGPMANNWMQVVVDAPVSRLAIQGFRFADVGANEEPSSPEGPEGAGLTEPKSQRDASWEREADAKAWRMWQANNMDSVSRMIHTDAVKLGKAYVLVAPPRKDGGQPVLTPEYAGQCFVELDPEDPTQRLAGIKRWLSPFDDRWYANIYLPDACYKFRATRKRDSTLVILGDRQPNRWEAIGKVENPSGVVPLIPIENKPAILSGGISDLKNAVPIQDAINKLCLDMIVSAEFHAFPQRWATGWTKATDDKGRVMSSRDVELYLSQSRFVRGEAEGIKFGQFASGDVENYIKPIEMYVDHLAAQTQTPLYYLKGQKTSQMSADAMHAQDQGLVDRCKAKILSFSDGWETVFRTGFLMIGDLKRGEAESAEVMWGDPESKSLAVLSQAAMIMYENLKLPLEACWELLDYSPQEIRMFKELLVEREAEEKQEEEAEQKQKIAEIGAAASNDPTTHPNRQPGGVSGMNSKPTKPKPVLNEK